MEPSYLPSCLSQKDELTAIYRRSIQSLDCVYIKWVSIMACSDHSRVARISATKVIHVSFNPVYAKKVSQ